MGSKNVLAGKTVLIIDDELDVIHTLKEILDLCIVHSATDYHSALQYLMSYSYDFVILDIMGVNGFDLLRRSVDRGFPTMMLTAHALTPDALEKSKKLGAVSFLPKEHMSAIREYMEDALKSGGRSIWSKLFARFGSYFDQRFDGPDWRKREEFLDDIEKEFSSS